MARTKSDWSKDLDILAAELPKNFDARKFRGCRNDDGTWSKAEIAKVSDTLGVTNKADAIAAFLTHKDRKPTGKAQKRKGKSPVPQDTAAVNLLSKKTYKGLSVAQVEKLIDMLTEIKADAKKSAIEELKARMEADQKALKELQGK